MPPLAHLGARFVNCNRERFSTQTNLPENLDELVLIGNRREAVLSELEESFS